MQKKNRIVGIGIVLGSAFGLLGGGLRPSTALAQMSSALAEAQDIRQQWPEALVHFPYEASWAGVEFVGGTLMTTRATAQEALEESNPRADVNQDGHIDLFDHLETVEQGMRCQ